ncbi:MAG: hypothetical protein P4M15_09915 [Alphaproteobacteria bacterium]|nr:hypothetical protein [Alphaproteobacteria bacterium]
MTFLPRVTLSDATKGFLPYDTVEHFVRRVGAVRAEYMIKDWAGLEKIADGEPQPLFDATGRPFTYTSGEPICLPWTLVEVFNRFILNDIGIQNMRGPDIAFMPAAFSGPTDVLLVTADFYAVNTLRSFTLENFPGKALAAAAGPPLQKDGGPENFAKRALLEAMDIGWDKEVTRIEQLPLVTDRKVLTHNVGVTHKDGRTETVKALSPGVGYTFIVQTRRTLEELWPEIRLGKKAAGIVAVKVSALEELRDDFSRTVSAIAGLSQQLNVALDDDVRRSRSLAGLRKQFEKAARKEIKLGTPQGNAPLYDPIDIRLAFEDINPDTPETLIKMLDGAAKLGLIPAQAVAAVPQQMPGGARPA